MLPYPIEKKDVVKVHVECCCKDTTWLQKVYMLNTEKHNVTHIIVLHDQPFKIKLEIFPAF